MPIALDHVFILTDPGAPQAELLTSVGIIEGTSNNHPGQGTANRRFFFANTTLELLYLRDASEATNGRAGGLRIADRATNCRASPFGLVVRASGASSVPAFPGWRYCPEYFPAGQCFHVGANSDLVEEPLCICMPHNLPARRKPPEPANLCMHMTDLRISVPVAKASPTLRAVANCDNISLTLDRPHRLELIFNNKASGVQEDFSPDLPLVLRW